MLIPSKRKSDGNESLPPNKKKKVEEIHTKPTAQKKNTKGKVLAMLTPPDLSMYAICWVKIRGFKDWPGVIEGYENDCYAIHFFGDYTTSVVRKNKITNFYEGFSIFSHTFNDPLLKKAIREATICLMREHKPTYCFVCSIRNIPKK